MRYFLLILTAALLMLGCKNGSTQNETDSTATTASSETAVSEVRNNPQTAPVQNYEQKVQNDLNDWYFRVQLYETKQRFVYRLRMEYEEIKEEQEIAFPNMNMEPQPKIQKGAKDYEAIVGFLDNKGEFKEYLKVFVEGEKLQLKQLKYYAVRTK